jgi:hypothetical protein
MCRRSGYPPSHWSAACFSSIGHLLLPLWLGLGHTDPSQGPNHFPRLIVLSRVELRQQLIRRRRYYQERSPLPAIRVSHYLTIPAPLQGGDRARSIEQPLATVCGNRGEMGTCDPFLIKYYGTGVATSVHTPLNSVTTHDRFALVRPIVTNRRPTIRTRYPVSHVTAARARSSSRIFTNLPIRRAKNPDRTTDWKCCTQTARTSRHGTRPHPGPQRTTSPSCLGKPANYN